MLKLFARAAAAYPLPFGKDRGLDMFCRVVCVQRVPHRCPLAVALVVMYLAAYPRLGWTRSVRSEAFSVWCDFTELSISCCNSGIVLNGIVLGGYGVRLGFCKPSMRMVLLPIGESGRSDSL